MIELLSSELVTEYARKNGTFGNGHLAAQQDSPPVAECPVFYAEAANGEEVHPQEAKAQKQERTTARRRTPIRQFRCPGRFVGRVRQITLRESKAKRRVSRISSNLCHTKMKGMKSRDDIQGGTRQGAPLRTSIKGDSMRQGFIVECERFAYIPSLETERLVGTPRGTEGRGRSEYSKDLPTFEGTDRSSLPSERRHQRETERWTD